MSIYLKLPIKLLKKYFVMGLVYWVGLLTIISFSVKILIWIYTHFIFKPNLKNLIDKNSWAVITGTTSGIGEGIFYLKKGFCEVLAKKGMNLVLVSRNESKIKEQAKTLGKFVILKKEEKFHIKTLYSVVDFSKKGVEKLEDLKYIIKDLKVTILGRCFFLKN
jgi:17beta-estradiol 17-dehydrogenase / very-long-chain 3-oxoacyl-CoA reductase